MWFHISQNKPKMEMYFNRVLFSNKRDIKYTTPAVLWDEKVADVITEARWWFKKTTKKELQDKTKTGGLKWKKHV